MWLLKKLNEDTTKYIISEQGSYSIGRKNCDIIFEEDASISRKHCILYIAKKNDCKFKVNTSTGVWLVDENSKYGTFLQNKNEWMKIKPNEDTLLSSGSIIKFGLLENIWSLQYKPIVACVSGFSIEQKKEMQNLLVQIDGELRNAWSNDCSLVIVNEITLTVKVVLALINGIPIVNINYVKKLVECVKNQTAIPDSKEYRPEMKENILDSSLVSLDPKDTRKNLFKNQVFIFPTKKQLETLRDVILCGGGKVDLLSFDESWDKYGKKNIVIIQLPLIKSSISDEIINKFQELEKFLKNKYMKRVVPESEIAQAVAYDCTEKYCNPSAEHFQIRISNKKPDLGVVLVEETQEYPEKNFTEPCFVPCSITLENFLKETDNQTSTSARKRNHSPDQLSPKPKMARNKNNDSNKTASKKTFAVEEKLCQQKKENNLSSKNMVAGKSSKNNKNFLMTDYFNPSNKDNNLNHKNKNLDEILSEYRKTSQIEINTSSFWDCTPTSTPTSKNNKRQLSPEKDSSEDVPLTKKSKQPNKIVCDEFNDLKTTTKEKILTSSSNNNEKENVLKEIIPTSSNSNNLNEHEKDFMSGFIEKDLEKSFKSSSSYLDNTVYSLSIISSKYLKADGTLIDPPETPFNVKRFKKQKIYTLNDIVAMESLEKEPEVSDWLKPHVLN